MTDILTAPMLETGNATKTLQLQTIVLPKLEICTVEELYVRLDDYCFLDYEQGQIELKMTGKLSFNPYFNAFSGEC